MLFSFLFLLLIASQGQVIEVSDAEDDDVYNCTGVNTTCMIIVTDPCSRCTFNCPMGECTFCSVECQGSVCRDSFINSFDCEEVWVSGSGSTVLEGATINGPEGGTLNVTISDSISGLLDATINGPVNGDLYVTIDSSFSGLREATINGPPDGNLYITSIESDQGLRLLTVNADDVYDVTIDVGSSTSGSSEAEDLIVNGKLIQNTLTVNCGGDCFSSEIYCPENSTNSGPSCFVDCTGDGCKQMLIDTVDGTPRDIKLNCGSDSDVCDSLTITCNSADSCQMQFDAPSSAWECNGVCNNPTNAPTVVPSSYPSEIPSSSKPTSEPSTIPSSYSSTVSSTSSSEPTVMPVDDTASDLSTTIINNADTVTSMSPTSMPIVIDDGSEKDDDNSLDAGTLTGIIIGAIVFLILVVLVALYICRREKKQEAEQKEKNVGGGLAAEMTPTNQQDDSQKKPDPDEQTMTVHDEDESKLDRPPETSAGAGGEKPKSGGTPGGQNKKQPAAEAKGTLDEGGERGNQVVIDELVHAGDDVGSPPEKQQRAEGPSKTGGGQDMQTGANPAGEGGDDIIDTGHVTAGGPALVAVENEHPAQDDVDSDAPTTDDEDPQAATDEIHLHATGFHETAGAHIMNERLTEEADRNDVKADVLEEAQVDKTPGGGDAAAGVNSKLNPDSAQSDVDVAAADKNKSGYSKITISVDDED